MHRPKKIISGGQTGADRAALDWAISGGVEHGGWCPKGRKAEDGRIAECYKLQETTRSDYPQQRTEWNVRDSDGTIVFTISHHLSGGSLKTLNLARRHGKPVLHVSREADGDDSASKLEKFIRSNGVKVLNIAGSRGSKEPEVGAWVQHLLEEALRK